MEHFENDAFYKILHKIKTIKAESAENFGIGLFKNIYRIRYKKIDVILVQCPFHNYMLREGSSVWCPDLC